MGLLLSFLTPSTLVKLDIICKSPVSTREIYFSWVLLALMSLLQAKLSSVEAEIKNKMQKLYGKEKKHPYC